MKKRDGRLRRRIDSVLQAGMGKQILALLACNAVFFALFLFLCGELGYGLAVGGGGDKDHLPAGGGQIFQRAADAGVLKAGADDLFAEGAGPRRPQQGEVVPLAAAGGEVKFPPLAADGAGQGGPGMGQGRLALGPRRVEGGGVGPVFQHGGVDDAGHLGVDDGGGRVVQILQLRVCAHRDTCFIS